MLCLFLIAPILFLFIFTSDFSSLHISRLTSSVDLLWSLLIDSPFLSSLSPVGDPLYFFESSPSHCSPYFFPFVSSSSLPVQLYYPLLFFWSSVLLNLDFYWFFFDILIRHNSLWRTSNSLTWFLLLPLRRYTYSAMPFFVRCLLLCVLTPFVVRRYHRLTRSHLLSDAAVN